MSWKETLALETIPSHMHEAVIRWLEHGIMPGGFLTAVLSNQLVESFGRADEQNKTAMHKWAEWLYNYCPAEAWGSEIRIKAWRAHGGLVGLEDKGPML